MTLAVMATLSLNVFNSCRIDREESIEVSVMHRVSGAIKFACRYGSMVVVLNAKVSPSKLLLICWNLELCGNSIAYTGLYDERVP